MARQPRWFEQLDSILVALDGAPIDWLGRTEVRALFGLGERDAIRLLHRFGAAQHHNALLVSRQALQKQLEAIRNGSSYAAFAARRRHLAEGLSAARSQSAARQFRVPLPQPRPSLDELPASITWRRETSKGLARFEILYHDGADLMSQLAGFLEAASADRTEFFRSTEPAPSEPES